MTNPSMPGLVKVGMTKKVPTLRAEFLNTTGVPTPFQTQYYAFFDDVITAERLAHGKLKNFHHGKEFFKTDVATVINAIESINIPFKKLYSKPEDDAKASKIRQIQEAARKRQEAEHERIEAELIKQEAERKKQEEEKKRFKRDIRIKKIRTFVVKYVGVFTLLTAPVFFLFY